jgi:PPOX class probable F420-dependent enzyme
MTVEFTQEVSDRFSSDKSGWLTTVAKSGQPVPRLVWFYFDGTDVIVYTEPNAAKVRHVRAHPRVSFNLDSDGNGAGIIIVGGVTSVDAEGANPLTDERYVAKYGEYAASLQQGVPRRVQHPAEDRRRQGLDDPDRRLTLVPPKLRSSRQLLALFLLEYRFAEVDQRKSRLRELTDMLSLPIRSATTVTAPLAFCT